MKKLSTLFFVIIFNNFLFSQITKTADNHKDKAINELMSGNKEIALIEINEAIKLNVNSADYYYVRGNVIEKMNDLNTALTNYKKAIFLDPKHTDASMKCGVMYAKLNDKIMACKYFKKACELGESKACVGFYKFCN